MCINSTRFFALILFALTVIWSDQASADGGVLRITGWDVYSAPDAQNKTIGYKEFEKKTGVKIEFSPLSPLYS